MRRSGVEPVVELAAFDEVVEGAVAVGVFEAVQLPDREPYHLANLGFVRLEPAVVRLIVGVESGHEFDVPAVFVGETVVGLETVGVVAVGPVFHAGADVSVAHPCGTCMLAVVVASEIVFGRVPREEGRRHMRVLPHAYVVAVIIKAVINVVGNGPCSHLALAVAGNISYRRGEDDLVERVAVHCGIGPEEEGVGERGPVLRTHGHLEYGGIGIDGVAYDGFHPHEPVP